MESSEKKPLIFISHSTKNKAYAERIVRLFSEMGVPDDGIFCTSAPGYDVGFGDDILKAMYDRLVNYNVFVVFLISKEYYESVYCLNEMGAAWILQNDYCSMLTPGTDYNMIQGVIEKNQKVMKLDNADVKQLNSQLNSLYEIISNRFLIKKTITVWEDVKERFISDITKIKNTWHVVNYN